MGGGGEANPFLPSVDGSYYWDVAGYTVLYCITGVLGNDVGNDMEGETGKCAAVLYNVGLLWGPRLWHVMVVGWRASNCRCQNTAKTCLHPCERRKK